MHNEKRRRTRIAIKHVTQPDLSRVTGGLVAKCPGDCKTLEIGTDVSKRLIIIMDK